MSTALLYILALRLTPATGILPLMTNSDLTLTSPLAADAQADGPLLAVTIAWHPDPGRIGEQLMWVGGVGNTGLELSRFLPLFRKPGKDGLGLGYAGISREPLRIVQDVDDGVSIRRPGSSRMAVEINGTEIYDTAYLNHDQIEAGAILSLGRAVLLCLHWMRCLPKHNPVDGLLGVGDAAIKTRDLIRQVAPTDATVLLLGETGTGKEVAAHGIHAFSRRANAPLVAVNMAALNESLAAADLFGASKGAYTGAQTTRAGLFSEAQDATLFLDEVGNTPAQVQPMLLRVLETGDYRPLGAQRDVHSNVRLIAATDQDLYGGGFNQALLRRLESFIIHIPPLRARREDIGLLLVHLLQSSVLPGSADIAFPAALAACFIHYDWPGNVRQLRHVAKRALLALQMGETPDFNALIDVKPARVTASAEAEVATNHVAESNAVESNAAESNATGTAPTRKKLTEISEADVLAAMEQHHWQIQGAAQALGVSRPSMYKLLETHSQIRPANHIANDDIAQALAACKGDVEDCAARLKTPAEALRRHMRTLGLLG
jgi:DNA-binding NtrC family response regulator